MFNTETIKPYSRFTNGVHKAVIESVELQKNPSNSASTLIFNFSSDQVQNPLRKYINIVKADGNLNDIGMSQLVIILQEVVGKEKSKISEPDPESFAAKINELLAGKPVYILLNGELNKNNGKVYSTLNTNAPRFIQNAEGNPPIELVYDPKNDDVPAPAPAAYEPSGLGEEQMPF